MEIINLIYCLSGILFFVGYTWTPKTSDDTVLAKHMNDLQDEKTDKDTVENNINDHDSFSDAIDSIGATESTLLIYDQQNVLADKTVPSNVTLRFLQGGTLNVSNTKTVTINGHVEASPVEIFEGAGTVVVNTYPQDQAWWDNTQRGDRGPTFFYGDIYTDRWQESDTNTFIGVGVVGAGNLAAAGLNNTAAGYNALNANTTGEWNTAFGKGALMANTSGNYNVAIGGSALVNCGTGSGNVALGDGSLHAVTSGVYNIGLGDNAGYLLTTGIDNIFIGYNAAYGDTPANAPLTDIYGILIGRLANRSVASANQLTNYIGIGYAVLIDKSNQVKIGNTSIVETLLQGNVGVGVVPEAWHAGFIALQIGEELALWGHVDGTGAGSAGHFTTNTYYDVTDSRYEYMIAGSEEAARYTQSNGGHSFLTAPVGTAGNPITFSTRLAIFNDGKVTLPGIPSTDAGDYDLRYDAADGIVYDTSDSRQKTDKAPLEYGLAEILQLQPQRYIYHVGLTGTEEDKETKKIKKKKIEITDRTKESFGLIAQDVYDIIPEAVYKPENEKVAFWGLREKKLIPIMVNAIKDLNNKIEVLEAQLIN